MEYPNVNNVLSAVRLFYYMRLKEYDQVSGP